VLDRLNFYVVVIDTVQYDVPAIREWYQELPVFRLVIRQQATSEGEFGK